MQYNTPMLQILNGSNNGLTEDDIAKADAFVSMLTENLHLINDCVLLRLPTFDITDKSKLKRYVTDEIGLEACQNEINLNIEMSVDPICVDLALYFFREFNKRLIDCQVKCNKINEKIYRALRGEYESQGVYEDDY